MEVGSLYIKRVGKRGESTASRRNRPRCVLRANQIGRFKISPPTAQHVEPLGGVFKTTRYQIQKPYDIS